MKQKCLSTFSANLEYFRQENLEIYEKIIHFNHLLSSNKVEKKYELKFSDDTPFLLDLATNRSLHLDASQDLQSITTISTEIFDDSFVKNSSFTKENLTSINNLKKLINTTSFNFKNSSKDINTSKLILIGVPFNNDFKNQGNINIYLLIEPIIDKFYLSMFILNYKEISLNSKMIFSISDDEDILLSKLNNFYSYNFTQNYIINYLMYNSKYNYLFNTISITLLNNNPLRYTYSSMIKDIKHKKINEKRYKYIDFNAPIFNNKQSILILSPGPSISQQIVNIKKLQNRFIIVAFAQTIPLLEKYKIKPDIITIIDSSELMKIFFEVKNKEFFKNVKLFTNNTVLPSILNNFSKKNVYLFDKRQDSIQGITVGESTYHIVLKLGAKNIYLLGTDLAIDKNKRIYDKSHKLHQNNNKIDTTRYHNKNNPMSDFQIIKGNLKKTIYTNSFFLQFIKNYNQITKRFNKSNITIYNLSDGAFLEDTIPLKNTKKLKKLPIVSKNLKIISHKKYDNISKRENEIQNINKLVDEIKKEKVQSLESLARKVLTIDEKNSYSIQRQHILYNYFNITLNFLNYIIASNFEFNYSLVYKIFINQIKNILEEYKKLCI